MVNKRHFSHMLSLTKVKAVFLLSIIGLVVYINSLNNNFIWDDDGQIVNNVMVHSLENLGVLFTGSTFGFSVSGQLSGIYYRPLMSTFFAIIYTIFGPNPFSFHLFQLLIHIANSIIVFLLFRYFFSLPLSFFLSAIFLVHPINSETILYVANTGDILFLFFGMLTLFMVNKGVVQVKNAIICGLFLLWALFSKETGILFFPIVFLWSLLYKRKNIAALCLILICVLSVYLFYRFGLAHIYFDKPDSTPLASLDFAHRMLSIPQMIFFYLSHFVLPINLSMAQLWSVVTLDFPTFWLPLFLDIAAILLLIFGGIYVKQYDREYLKAYIFFGVWFLLGLFAHMHIMPLDMTVADRWFYFPIIGLLALIGIIIKQALIRYPRLHIWVFSLFSIVIFLFSILTIVRSLDWRDGVTLFKHDLSISKNNYQLESLLAYEFNKKKNYPEALISARRSVEHFPTYSGWSNLGVAAIKTGNIDEGITAFKNAYALMPYEDVAQNLAYALLIHRQSDEAKDFIQKRLTEYPNNPNFWFYFAVVSYKSGNTSDAISSAQQCYSLSLAEKCKTIYDKLQQNQKIPQELLQ